MKKIVIVGCGQAGFSAAKALLRLQPDAQITMFDEEERGFYARMRLPEFLGGTLAPEKLMLSTPAATAALGIDFEAGRKIVRLDVQRHECGTNTGERHVYDNLILATGANAFLPPVRGIENVSPFTLRTFDDAAAIVKAAAAGKKALVLGGGLLGLEAAGALLKRGMDVTVAENAQRLLPRQLDCEASDKLRARMETMNYKFMLGADAVEFVPARGGFEARFSDGCSTFAELLLVSAGIRPRIGLAASANLRIGRGITVGPDLRTSADGVYAAGDCAELCGRVCGLWSAARDQGTAAAEIISGTAASFVSPDYKPMPKIAGIDMKTIL